MLRPSVRRENAMHSTHDIDLSFLDDVQVPAMPASVATTWDTATAIRLTEAADASVEQHGSCGREPEIQALAEQAAVAFKQMHIGNLRVACFLIIERAHRAALNY